MYAYMHEWMHELKGYLYHWLAYIWHTQLWFRQARLLIHTTKDVGIGVLSLVPLPTYLPFYANVRFDLSKTIQLEYVTCLEFASRIGFDRKVSCLTYFYLTRFPIAKSEFQTRFETRTRYSQTPPETVVIVNRERINNLLRRIYVGSNWNPNTITKPLGEKSFCFLRHQLMGWW